MSFIKKNILTALLLSGSMAPALAQAPGSATVYGGPSATLSVKEGTSVTEVSESLIIGPGTYIINGVWKIYSKNIIIDPAADISGTGGMEIYNPADAGGSDSRTFLDGNASAIPVEINITLLNSQGLELKNKDVPAELVAAGFSNNAASSAYIGKDLDLATDGANIWLDSEATGDLRFTADAGISQYGLQRMIITNNSIVSHVVRDEGSEGFFFPVGIAPADYTPVNLSGDKAYHVSVIDYSAAVPEIENPEKGMDRSWHIFGGAADTLTLFHNSPATDGAQFQDDKAFITRYQGGGQWSSGTAYRAAAGVHSNASAIASGIPVSGNADGAWLTKSSTPASPLPVVLLVFNAEKEGNTSLLSWETTAEENLAGFEVERSTDGQDWRKIGYVASQSQGAVSRNKANYSLVDEQPRTGRNFYRLKMKDIDGRFTMSEVRSVWFDNERHLAVYPNPFSGRVTVEGLEGNEDIQVFDQLGRIVYREQAESGKLQLDLESLSDGAYQIRVLSPDGAQSVFKVDKVK